MKNDPGLPVKNKNCRECRVALTPENTKPYRLKNYVYLCNACDRDQKAKQARIYREKLGPQTVALRSYRHNRKVQKENPKKYTARQQRASAKKRAAAYGWDFDLTTDYLLSIAPDTCPILGIKLKYGGGEKNKHSASLDRIDSSKGYVKDNVWVISSLANRMKADATACEMRAFADWVNLFEPKKRIS